MFRYRTVLVVSFLCITLSACTTSTPRAGDPVANQIARTDAPPLVRSLKFATSQRDANLIVDSEEAYLTALTLQDDTGRLWVDAYASSPDFRDSRLIYRKSDALVGPTRPRSLPIRSFDVLSATWAGNHWALLGRETQANAPSRYWLDAMRSASIFGASRIMFTDGGLTATNAIPFHLQARVSGTNTRDDFLVTTFRVVGADPDAGDFTVELVVLLVQNWTLATLQEIVVDRIQSQNPTQLDLAVVPARSGPGDGWLIAYENGSSICGAFVRAISLPPPPPAGTAAPVPLAVSSGGCGQPATEVNAELATTFNTAAVGDTVVDRVLVDNLITVPPGSISGSLAVAGEVLRFRPNSNRYLLAFKRTDPGGSRLIVHRFFFRTVAATLAPVGAVPVRTTDYGPTLVASLGVPAGEFLNSNEIYLDYDRNSQAHWMVGYWDLTEPGSVANLKLRWLGATGATTHDVLYSASSPYLAGLNFNGSRDEFAIVETNSLNGLGVYGFHRAHDRLNASTLDLGFGCAPPSQISLAPPPPAPGARRPYAGDDFFQVQLTNGPRAPQFVLDFQLNVSPVYQEPAGSCGLAADMTAPGAKSFPVGNTTTASGTYTTRVGLGDGAGEIYSRLADQQVLPVMHPDSLPDSWVMQWSWTVLDGNLQRTRVTSPALWVVIAR